MLNLIYLRTMNSFSLPCCGCYVVVFYEFVELIDVYPGNLLEFDYVSTEGHGLDCARVDLIKNLPPSAVKDEPHTIGKGYLSDCCRFTRVLLSLAALGMLRMTVT